MVEGHKSIPGHYINWIYDPSLIFRIPTQKSRDIFCRICIQEAVKYNYITGVNSDALYSVELKV